MIFKFEWKDNYDLASFYINRENRMIMDSIFNFKAWPGSKLVLCGPPKSGKTHIGKIWAKCTSARIITEGTDISLIKGPCVIDALDDFVEDEHSLMRIFYLTREHHTLWLSSKRPNEIFFRLNDLKTRFAAITVLTVNELDDELFKKILEKRLLDFGLEMAKECLEYLTRRSVLKYHAIDELVYAIHNTCLTKQKSPSLNLVSQCLERMSWAEKNSRSADV